MSEESLMKCLPFCEVTKLRLLIRQWSAYMEISIITAKGQIVVPARIRRKLKIKKGSRVVIIEQEDGFKVKPLDRKYFEQFAGILPTKGKATKALLEERGKSRRNPLGANPAKIQREARKRIRRLAGILGTKGKMLKSLLKDKRKEREL
jgi:AbrB family looped-hinge helix DNA binding protein